MFTASDIYSVCAVTKTK